MTCSTRVEQAALCRERTELTTSVAAAARNGRIGDLQLASAAAAALRRQVASDDEPVDLIACCALAHVRVEHADLGAARGGLQGMLVPLPEGRFRIAVDPTPRGGWGDTTRELREPLTRQRFRFRVAHELGHTFFYERSINSRPRRVSRGGSAQEEAFCDEFARHLLVPKRTRLATATDVVVDHGRYDVSLELAARAAASGQGAPTVAVWRWDRPAEGRRAALHVQWSAHARLAAAANVVEFRTDPRDLPRRFFDARRRLGQTFSAIVLPERRQALAVLA